MPGLRRKACSRAGIITFVIAGVRFAGACSGSSGHLAAAASSSSGAPASASGAGFQAYRDCLSQHGVTLPARNRNQSNGSDSSDSAQSGAPRGNGGGTGGFNGQFSAPPGVDQATFDAAQKACAGLRPTGGGGGGRGGAAAAAYRSCLADHGVTVPSTSSGGPPASIDRNDPNFAAANQACRALLPNRGSSNSSSSTASSTSG